MKGSPRIFSPFPSHRDSASVRLFLLNQEPLNYTALGELDILDQEGF